MTNVIVPTNNSNHGSCIYVYDSSISFAGVTVSYNNGGGIYFGWDSSATFSDVNRSNIYMNNCFASNNLGNDLLTNQDYFLM